MVSKFKKLAGLLSKLPGIGPRQAKRFAYFLLTRDDSYNKTLSDLIIKLKKEIRQCSSCLRFMPERKSTVCSICADPGRDDSLLCIVTNDVDLDAFEKGGTYIGKYFVIGGNIPILEKEPESRVRIKRLADYVEGKKPTLREIILALNATPEGEHTAEFISSSLSEIIKSKNIKLSHLGRGLSTGTELEYADPDTIKNAFKHRE